MRRAFKAAAQPRARQMTLAVVVLLGFAAAGVLVWLNTLPTVTDDLRAPPPTERQVDFIDDLTADIEALLDDDVAADPTAAAAARRFAYMRLEEPPTTVGEASELITSLLALREELEGR